MIVRSVQLSSDELYVILSALDGRIKSLEELHWRAVSAGGIEPIYQNIDKEICKCNKAKTAVSALFEAQFKHDLPTSCWLAP